MSCRVKLSYVVVALLAAFGLLCCGKSSTVIPSQRRAIESFLAGKPYSITNGVYVYVVNANRDSYADDPVAAPGDSVYFMFAQYVFTSALPTVPYYTNRKDLILKDTILNRQYWSFDPVGVKVGSSPLLEGMALGLPGCHQNDSVVMLITSDLAYDDKTIGVVPSNTAIMVSMNINTVKKQR